VEDQQASAGGAGLDAALSSATAAMSLEPLGGGVRSEGGGVRETALALASCHRISSSAVSQRVSRKWDASRLAAIKGGGVIQTPKRPAQGRSQRQGHGGKA
jgi:hypothetical protein